MKSPFGEEVYLKTSQTEVCRLYGCDYSVWAYGEHVVESKVIRCGFCEKHTKQILGGELYVAGIVAKRKDHV